MVYLLLFNCIPLNNLAVIFKIVASTRISYLRRYFFDHSVVFLIFCIVFLFVFLFETSLLNYLQANMGFEKPKKKLCPFPLNNVCKVSKKREILINYVIIVF